MSLERALERLAAGGTFSSFARETRRYWDSQARYLLRKWSVPADVERDDIAQELLLAAWRAIPKFDPSRGKSLFEFVRWNSVNAAKKYMHRQRCALRRDDKAKSRHHLSFSRMRLGKGRLVADGEVDPGDIFPAMACAEIQEQVYDLESRITRLASEDPRFGAAARVLAVCEFDENDAAGELYADLEVRRVLQLGCEREALDLVRRTVSALSAA